jgi:membrane protein
VKDRLVAEGNHVRVPMTRGRLGLADLVQRTLKEMGPDNTMSFAKAVAFSSLLAIFPMLVFILAALGLFHADTLLTRAVNSFQSTMPHEAYVLLTQQIIPGLTSGRRDTGLSVTVVLTIALAIWGMSGAVRELMNALNVMYGVTEGRSAVRKYLASFALAVGTALLLVVAATLVVGGPALAGWVGDHVGGGEALKLTWIVVQWPILAVMVLLAFALIYYYAPDVDQEFRFITVGSGVAFVLWLVFTGAFSLYVNNFGSYDKSYGALAGVIVLMLYLNYSALLLLFGAEMNQVIEDAAPDGKDEGQKDAGAGPPVNPRPS